MSRLAYKGRSRYARSSTSTWTRSTPRSSNAIIRASAASPSLSAARANGAWSRLRATRLANSAFARRTEPILTRSELPGDRGDTQRRYIEAAVQGVIIASLYLPNGNPRPGPKFDYKLAWFERLIAHVGDLRSAGVPVILAGDYNVVPTDHGHLSTKSWANDALLQPESRAAFRRLLDQGWTDALRTVHPAERMFTFWDYKRNRWARDAGLRPDHLLLSQTSAKAAGPTTSVRFVSDIAVRLTFAYLGGRRMP
jgi:exodeoxyribonuclease-3